MTAADIYLSAIEGWHLAKHQQQKQERPSKSKAPTSSNVIDFLAAKRARRHGSRIAK
jgi:hypothetical protein